MNDFNDLLACAGAWQGRNRVQPSLIEPADDSDTRLLVTPVLRDTFVRLDQAWSWKGQPQSGSMLIGYDLKSGAACASWIDTWHNGRRIMPLSGAFDAAEGKLVLNGHFPVAGGPDWGWRIEIRATADRLRINMACLHPAGEEDGGVWAELGRAHA